MHAEANRPTTAPLRGDEGVALVLTILVMLIIGAMATGAALISANHALITRYYERESVLETVADAGMEYARARLNAEPSIYPDSGYATLENGVAVQDGAGSEIPGVQRWTYAGPTGITTGQYGVFGTIVTVVRDQGGGVVIRRRQINQESFAKFAYFTDVEPSTIAFGGGDQIFGPVHSNDEIKVYSSGATFYDEARTAKWVEGEQYSNTHFLRGFEEYVPEIAMPETADLTKLQTYAAQGNTSITGSFTGGNRDATTRIEFLAIDVNGDGDATDDNEGFMRVYQVGSSDDMEYLMAKPGPGSAASCGWDWSWSSGWEWECTPAVPGMDTGPNCGDYHGGTFVTAEEHPFGGHSGSAALTSSSRRCFLGGDPELNGGTFDANLGSGSWLPWSGTPHADLVTAAALRDDLDAGYLFPLNRLMNPNFRGVVFVAGHVAISGVLRGRITIAATGDIVIADDFTYATNPGAGTCADLAGLFSGDDVVVSDNALNSPWRPGTSGTRRTYDDTRDEFIHGVILALSNFEVENYDSGGTSEEDCGTENNGRGCLFLTGGIIQSVRGAVGTSSGSGYVKRYSYDACAAAEPPPYFPTTGYFVRGPYYMVDPVGFSVPAFYAALTPQG